MRPGVKPPEVLFGCERCSRSTTYVLEPQPDGSLWPIDPAGQPTNIIFAEVDMVQVLTGESVPVPRVKRLVRQPLYGSTKRRKGPATADWPRLRSERFDGRTYLRVTCKCGRNDKLGQQKLDELMFYADGTLRLLDGDVHV
jgi:hypothetical protein